jgi:hypothetical protein
MKPCFLLMPHALYALRWAAIAGKMAEKTSKQCRRRWQIIMNLIGKKGGWSEEEDRLLLEVSTLPKSIPKLLRSFVLLIWKVCTPFICSSPAGFATA